MKIDGLLSDDAILQTLGQRLAALRLERNLTQASLAAEAGVSKRTVERLESGEVAARLSAFLRVCRALGLVERLDALVPEPSPSPIELLRRREKTRKRASFPRGKSSATPPSKWTWGDNA